MDKKLLFIDPPGWQGAVHGNPAFPNVGIAYLVPPLKKDGWEIKIFDMNNVPFNDGQLLEMISSFQPHVVAFSCKSATFKEARRLALMVREHSPNVKIVFGGPHITLNGTELLESQPLFADLLFSGEGELDLPIALDIMLDLRDKSSLKNGRFAEAKKEGVYHYVPNGPLDLNELDFPDYSLFPENVLIHNREQYPLITSRGCPFHCIYCTVPLISGNHWRARNVDSIINELEYVKEKYNVSGFQIVDDAWNVDMNRCKEMCLRLVGKKSFHWTLPNGIRADRIDDELASLMKAAGCTFSAIGVESGSPTVFAHIGKSTSLEKIANGARILRKHGISIAGFFIIGLPYDNPSHVDESISFALANRIIPHFNILVPYQHTQVFKEIAERGRFQREPTDVSLHFSLDLSLVKPIFEWSDFSAKQMVQCYVKAILRTHQFHHLIPFTPNRVVFYLKILKMYLKYDKKGLIPFMWGTFQRRILRRNVE